MLVHKYMNKNENKRTRVSEKILFHWDMDIILGFYSFIHLFINWLSFFLYLYKWSLHFIHQDLSTREVIQLSFRAF